MDVLSNRWYNASLSGHIPADASMAEIILGADQPNVRSAQYLAISDVSFRLYPRGKVIRQCERPVELYGEPPTQDELDYPKRLINEDGFIIVDGKPFFPIGMYGVWKNRFNRESFDCAFTGLKEAGFNTVQTYNCARGDEFTAFLDAADRHGIRVMTFPGGPNSFQSELVTCIPAERHRKCHLAWYLADDTSDGNIPIDLRNLTRLCHRLDPTRLTAQADAVGTGNLSKYTPFVDATDIFLPEVYPVTAAKADGKEIPKVILDMKMIADDLAAHPGRRRSIWPIIQHFEGWKAWARFPTAAELRAMCYQAIIHGANGLFIYTYIGMEQRGHGVTSSPEKWQEVTAVSREIAALADDLVCPRARVQPSVVILAGPQRDARGFDSVSVLLKESPNGRLLIAGNSSMETVQARIKVDNFRGATLIFENGREIGTSETFDDVFTPLEVHVYRLK